MQDNHETPIIERPAQDLVCVRGVVGGKMIVRPRRPKKISRHDEKIAREDPPKPEEFAARVVTNAAIEAEYRAGLVGRKSFPLLAPKKQKKRAVRAQNAYQLMRIVAAQAKEFIARQAANRAIADGLVRSEAEGPPGVRALSADNDPPADAVDAQKEVA